MGNFGNGVLKAVSAFQNAGMADVAVDGMHHECHNEQGREKVYEDIFALA